MREATNAPRIRVVEADAFERVVALRLPFRFGGATVVAASQAFVRVLAEDRQGRRRIGWSADLMMPKWFDKRPERSGEQNVADLRRTVQRACEVARECRAWGSLNELSRRLRAELGSESDPNPLLAGFGPSLVERAAIDALGRIAGCSFGALLRDNALGFSISGEALGIDVDVFLRRLALPSRIAVRHTVGIVDPLTCDDLAEPPSDDLPVSLSDVLDRHGIRWLKVKLSGDAELDLARLGRIAALLDRRGGGFGITLDGNESFASVDGVLAFWDSFEADPALARLRRSVAYLEQPLARSHALDDDVRPIAARVPVVIDESDSDDAAFVRARDRGYAGVSVKSCKGVFRALANALRCVAWNGGNPSGCPYFLTGEDLTAQAGLAVQQDLALAATLGVAHVERNGHFFASGMQGASRAEQERFVSAHPDLYEWMGAARLRVRDGALTLASLDCVGFASAAHPDASCMTPLAGA